MRDEEKGEKKMREKERIRREGREQNEQERD